MKLYIAGPMTGLPEFNYPAFNTAERKLQVAGHETLNPTMGQAAPVDDGTTWQGYMRRGLRMLSHADGVALLPGWQDSKGALLETNVAAHLGMPVLTLDEWLSGGVA